MIAQWIRCFPLGYFTEFENGYKLIISGVALGETAIQEAMIVNHDSVHVARDTEEIREISE